MQKFHSEFAHSYNNYSFGYCQYAKKEKDDTLRDIYNEGFLPYSGHIDAKDIFYMARSGRIDLDSFSLTSENRRITKKLDSFFSKSIVPIKNFLYSDKNFLNFCQSYFNAKHGRKIMSEERLLTILEQGPVSHIITYTKGDDIVAHVFIVSEKDFSHFWFSFYDLSYADQSLGMWLMIDVARLEKENRKKHLYVGTVYGDESLYKTNLRPIEYWDGEKWNKDVKELRKKVRLDVGRTFDVLDEWKQGKV